MTVVRLGRRDDLQALPNDASLALHELFGFRPVGTFTEVGRKFGRYWDVTWLERELS